MGVLMQVAERGLAGPWGLDGHSEISGETIIRASDGSVVARVCCGRGQSRKAAAIATLPLLVELAERVASDNDGSCDPMVRALARSAMSSIERGLAMSASEGGLL